MTTGARRLHPAWVATIVVALAVVAGVIFVGPHELLLRVYLAATEDTEYAPGYSERAFRAVELGDAEAEVLAALGEPLSERVGEPSTTWLYADGGHGRFEARGHYPDIRHSFTTLHFHEDGTFDYAFGQLSGSSEAGLLRTTLTSTTGDGANTLGLSDSQVEELRASGATTVELEARFGPPDAVHRSDVVRWLVYSHSPGSHNYRQRLLGVDRDGRVCEKVSEPWWD